MDTKFFFHLPGLFEHYEFYRSFLPLFYEHREYFCEDSEIGSIYGAPADCLWGGGRVECATATPEEAFGLLREYGISARLTFSNSLLREDHLKDAECNRLCEKLAAAGSLKNGVIVHSEILTRYLKEFYPELYLVSSTTKVLTDFKMLEQELSRKEFAYVVPDFRLNPQLESWKGLTSEEKAKVEFLCNECCFFGCKDRKACYEAVSRRNLGEQSDFACQAPGAKEGYVFSNAMENPGFISRDRIEEVYGPMGYSQYKLEGRGLGSALILEFLLYYMTKPEYVLRVREKLYLNHSLDLF